jgi:hypothetical protein
MGTSSAATVCRADEGPPSTVPHMTFKNGANATNSLFRVVDFTNILRAAFAPTIFSTKNYKAKPQIEKSSKKHFSTKCSGA